MKLEGIFAEVSKKEKRRENAPPPPPPPAEVSKLLFAHWTWMSKAMALSSNGSHLENTEGGAVQVLS